MATVTNTIKLPDGTAPSYAAVVIELVASTTGRAAGWVTANDNTILSTSRPTVTAGAWSADLTPNANITPSGTVYKVTETADKVRYIHYIEVDSDGGSVFDLLTDAPATVESSALAAHKAQASGAHAASAISFAATGGISGSTVEAAFGNVSRLGIGGHLPVRSRIQRSRGGYIGTSGKGVVAFRVDHGVDPFLATFWPLMRDRGIPAGLGVLTGCVNDPADSYEPTSSTWANILTANWEGVEVWSHSHTHLDPAPLGSGGTLTEEINTSKSLIEAQGMMVMGWQMPGVPGVTTPSYSALFDSLADFNSEVGQRLLETYGLIECDIDGVRRQLPTDGCYGLSHFTIDTVTLAQAQAQVDLAVRFGWGLELMFHPRYLNGVGYMSTADFTSLLDYVKTLWDAGSIEVLTPSGLAFADPGRTYRMNLLSQTSFEGITRSGTTMGDWSLSSNSSAITLKTDGGRTGDNYVRFDPTTAYAQQANAHVFQIGASGGTFIAEGWCRAPGTNGTARLIVLDNSGATAFTLTKTQALTGGAGWTRVRLPFTIPPLCTNLTVRIGWSAGSTVDWDDVTVQAI